MPAERGSWARFGTQAGFLPLRLSGVLVPHRLEGMGMRLLAALMVGSGAAWVAGILVANPYLLVPALPPVFIIAVCYVVVAAGVVLATQRHSQLPGRLIALWALAIIALGVSLAPAGPSLPLVGAAFLFGTIGFVLWIAPPLLVFSFLSTFTRTPGPVSRSIPQPPPA